MKMAFTKHLLYLEMRNLFYAQIYSGTKRRLSAYTILSNVNTFLLNVC